MFGPGVEKSGLKANEPTHFTVDCTEAGEGERASPSAVMVGCSLGRKVLFRMFQGQ